MERTLYIIDGYAQIFRAYYAIRNGMTSPVTGEPTHAVFGFVGMLHKIIQQLQPDFLVVAIDEPGDTFRDDLYSEYKANRPPMPEDLIPQIPRIRSLLELYGIPVLAQSGFEADDIIASVVRQVLENPALLDVRIKIVSRDKDLEQLLCERVCLYDVHKEETVDEASLLAEKGITPAQVVDMLALTGDTADNIPGVKGIGPKTAAQLLQEYGSIEGIYANIDQIRGKRRENLLAAKDMLPLTRELVTLRADADITFDPAASTVGPIDVEGILRIFQDLGFRRHQEEVKKIAEQLGTAPSRPSAGRLETADETAAALDPTPSMTEEKGHYELILDREHLTSLVNELKNQTLISIDTETTGLGPDARLCGISLAWEPGRGVYIPTLSPTPEGHMDVTAVVDILRPILEDPSIRKCGHNLKFDSRVLLRAGTVLRGIFFDTMLASILLDPERPSHRLDDLVSHYLDYGMQPIHELIDVKNGEVTMAQVDLDRACVYAAEDADLTLRLYKKLETEIEARGMTRLLTEVESPLAGVLAAMEEYGILCHPEALQQQEDELTGHVEDLRRQIFALAGEEFNLDSPKQLAEMLFERLGFEPVKKTKTGYSTDVEVLTQLASDEKSDVPHSAIPRLILEYRQLNKLITTYLGNLREAIDPRTGRIHSTFRQLVTATGRLASQDPNLQNIPIRTDVGRQIRKAFTAPEGHLLLSADYSQIELRILAHLSEDPGLIEAFRQDDDIHAAVASRVFGVPIDAVNPTQRARAKVINFGIIYGITAYGLSRRIPNLSVQEAARLIDDYRERFPGIERFLQECIAEAEEKGYVTTILGRRRAIPEIRSTNRNRKSHGERLAINTVVQGSAADLIKVAMVNLYERIQKEKLSLKLLLQIHDELVFEVESEQAEQAAKIVQEEMEHALDLRVPIKAEVGMGPNWMDVK